MKKIVIAPDSFKGTLSSIEVCEIIERAIKKISPETIVIKVPIADGGEGLVEAFLYAKGGAKVYTEVNDPFMHPVNACYAVLNDGITAIIEMAQASGLPLVGDKMDPMRATTYGTGELILDAVNKGCQKIILGIGGSATVDGGVGAAAALGIRFLDHDGNGIELNGGGLKQLYQISSENADRRLRETELLIACDVGNVLCGENGASYVYGPQKGASADQVAILDRNLKHLAEIIRNKAGVDYSQVPGTGAAGGLAVSLMAFAGAKIVTGIDTVIKTVGLEQIMEGADLIITGEGKIDGQSLQGKAPIGVSRLAKKLGIPVVAVAGSAGDQVERIYSEGITAVFTTVRDCVPFETAKKTCREDLAMLVENLMIFKNI